MCCAGQYREFYTIIAVVIGGTLLTGGYGTVIGAFFGALIVGMVNQGIVFAGFDAGLVPGLPGRDAARGRAGQPLHPPARDGRTA